MKTIIILKNAVESTTSGYCTDSLRDFDDFLLHGMGDTPSAKNHQSLSKNQHINPSRYDSTAFFRIKLFLMTLSFYMGLFLVPVYAAQTTTNKIVDAQTKLMAEETRFPIGCKPVGYQQRLKIISLFPGKEGALQSLYFFYNKLPQAVSLYHMRDENSEYSTRVNHTIGGNQWAGLATAEPLVKFICTLGDGKTSYGKIIDCADSIKICQYTHVKFGLNNKGNFWIVDGTTRNGAVDEVVHYGIIPGA